LFFKGITSPPYRRTLCEWFKLIFSRLPQCCQRKIQRHSKTIQTATVITRIQNTSTPQHVRITVTNDQQKLTTTFDDINISEKKNNGKKECISLLPR
jgi:hypothetical protein